MKKSSFIALIIALLLHLLMAVLLWILYNSSEHKSKIKKEDNRIKISLKEMPKSKKESGKSKKKVKRNPLIAPPLPKGKQLKKIVHQKPIIYKEKKLIQKPTLNKKIITKEKTHTQVKKVKNLPTKKSYIKVKKTKKDPMAWMYEDKSDQEIKKKKEKQFSGAQAGGTIKEMKELYGEEWGKLTYGQQKYMLDNQEIMRRITQEILTRVARVNLSRSLHVNRKNIIEFYLHPNGDMSDFKFLSKSGYYELDDTTRETIEYAYSRYPRPKEKILIRYNVYYHLANY